ncbi:hypothetical protein LCGC14_1146180 [marine sediment metagenome]|uniref:Uncharacterized protein n=1 Tax=marine sediment metagenome TaxID=412755 RepID=A0A0F9M1N7_9ZZZZ
MDVKTLNYYTLIAGDLMQMIVKTTTANGGNSGGQSEIHTKRIHSFPICIFSYIPYILRRINSGGL